MEMKFCCAPILFDEVQFTVILGIKIIQMPMGLDQLLKLRPLRDEIGLQKEYSLAAAVCTIRGATKAQALGKKIRVSLGPQTMLPNNDFHALEPTGHRGMVFRKIKRLWFTIWKGAAAHAWAVMVV
jgi:hypothetical protein